mgnify:CR=1 FL=1
MAAKIKINGNNPVRGLPDCPSLGGAIASKLRKFEVRSVEEKDKFIVNVGEKRRMLIPFA